MRTSILEPVIKLIAGEPPAAALPDNLTGLVFYRIEEVGEAGWRLVAADPTGMLAN